MAITPTCELNDGLDAGYIIGMVDTGQQLFLCPGHAAHFGLTLALQLLEPAEIINAAQAIGATPPQNGQPEAPANKPARKRRAKATAPPPPADPQQGGAEEPTATDDR